MAFTPKELTWLGLAKEASWGVAVAPTYYIPFADVKPEDVITYLKDTGVRGALSSVYNVFTGVESSTFEVQGDAFPDSIGLMFLAALGSDTVTGSSSPYTHTFKLNRTAQPPSLTPTYYDGTTYRQFSGCVVEEMDITWADNAALTYTVKMQGKPSSTTTSTTPSATATIPFAGWQFSCTLGGSANINLVGFSLNMKRTLYVQHTANNSNTPTNIIATNFDVTGKATFDKADDTELSAFLNNTQPAFVLTGTQPTTNYQLTFTMTKCAFIKDAISGKEVVQGDVDFQAVDNTTDNGPIQIKLVNAVASY